MASFSSFAGIAIRPYASTYSGIVGYDNVSLSYSATYGNAIFYDCPNLDLFCLGIDYMSVRNSSLNMKKIACVTSVSLTDLKGIIESCTLGEEPTVSCPLYLTRSNIRLGPVECYSSGDGTSPACSLNEGINIVQCSSIVAGEFAPTDGVTSVAFIFYTPDPDISISEWPLAAGDGVSDGLGSWVITS